MLYDRMVSFIRTATPLAVGALLAWLARQTGIGAVDQLGPALTEVLTFALAMAYYELVRALEHRWPSLGWLLGVPKAPTYSGPAGQS